MSIARFIANAGLMILLMAFATYAAGEVSEKINGEYNESIRVTEEKIQLENDRLEAVAIETGSDIRNVLYKHRTPDGKLYQTNDAYYIVVFEGETANIKTIVFDGKPGDKGEQKTEISF